MVSMFLVVFTVFSMCILHAQSKKANFGPWRGIVNKVGPCVDAEHKDLTPSMRFSVRKNGKYGRSLSEGKIDATFGFTNDYTVAAVLNEFKNNKWHTLVNHDMGQACQAFNKHAPSTWKLLIENSENVTSFKIGDDVCISSGDVTVKPFDLPPIEMPNIPTFIYGDYVGEVVQFHPNKTKFLCTAVYVSVVPLDDLKG